LKVINSLILVHKKPDFFLFEFSFFKNPSTCSKLSLPPFSALNILASFKVNKKSTKYQVFLSLSLAFSNGFLKNFRYSGKLMDLDIDGSYSDFLREKSFAKRKSWNVDEMKEI